MPIIYIVNLFCVILMNLNITEIELACYTKSATFDLDKKRLKNVFNWIPNCEAISCYVATHLDPEEMRKRAMADPEVQDNIRDPAMRHILFQMQNDTKALSYHLKNLEIASKDPEID